MPDQAGKLSSERNGGYTRLMGPFHPAVGHGGQLSSLRSAGTQVQLGRKSFFRVGEQFSCTVCTQYSWSGFQQFVYTVCTLYNLTGLGIDVQYVLYSTYCISNFFWNILECSLLCVQFDLLSPSAIWCFIFSTANRTQKSCSSCSSYRSSRSITNRIKKL